MVTAELAVCLPVLMLLVAAALGLVEVGAAQVRALDAATQAARGDPAAARRLAGEGAPRSRVSVVTTGGEVRATVTLREPLLGGLLPPVTITETAVAAAEPTVPP
jgi:hypothetical protein